MSIFKTLCGFYLITWISISINVSASKDDDPPSAYDMLEKFNFPRRILPEGVKGYLLHEDNIFEVFLDGNYKFEIEQGGYYLNYKEKITRKVELGTLKELQGVSVKVMFMWFCITEVSNTGDGKLNFYVGPLSTSFPLSNFDESLQFGSGLNSMASTVSAA